MTSGMDETRNAKPEIRRKSEDQNSKAADSSFRIRPLGIQSDFWFRISGFRARGYTLVELFLTLAVLMIVLGMMINLSNRVRRSSADKATRQMLSRLATLMAQ